MNKTSAALQEYTPESGIEHCPSGEGEGVGGGLGREERPLESSHPVKYVKRTKKG